MVCFPSENRDGLLKLFLFSSSFVVRLLAKKQDLDL